MNAKSSLSRNGLHAVVLTLSFAAHSQTYVVTDLGTLGGNLSGQAGDSSCAYGINNNGLIAGESVVAGPQGYCNAFLYSDGIMQNLGTLPGNVQSYANGINDKGQIVGYCMTSEYLQTAFIFSGGIMQSLGSIATNSDSLANGINNKGQVVGSSVVSGGAVHGFLYSGGVMQDLGSMGGNYSVAYGINDNGQIVGVSGTSVAQKEDAFLYNAGTMQDLGTLGGNFSTALAINNKGEIIGYSTTASNESHAFIYTNGVMVDLGTLGGSLSYALGINDEGQIVGLSYTSNDSAIHAFLYTNGTMVDLDNLLPTNSGWTFDQAGAINNSGQIVGAGFNPIGQEDAFLLSPFPSHAIPALSIVLNATNSVIVMWPTSLTGYVLEQNASLGITNWVANTNLVNVVNGTNEVIVAPTGGTMFFKLATP